MAKHILFCENCKQYTLHETCLICGGKALPPQPPKFSVEDRYEQLKRKAKEVLYKKRELL
jgi:H/ACA ribonucleoprotein complex subunit 3